MVPGMRPRGGRGIWRMTRAGGAGLNPAHYISRGPRSRPRPTSSVRPPSASATRPTRPEGLRRRSLTGFERRAGQPGLATNRADPRRGSRSRPGMWWTAAVLDAPWPPPAATTTPAAILTEIAVTLIAARVKRKKVARL